MGDTTGQRNCCLGSGSRVSKHLQPKRSQPHPQGRISISLFVFLSYVVGVNHLGCWGRTPCGEQAHTHCFFGCHSRRVSSRSLPTKPFTRCAAQRWGRLRYNGAFSEKCEQGARIHTRERHSVRQLFWSHLYFSKLPDFSTPDRECNIKKEKVKIVFVSDWKFVNMALGTLSSSSK